MFTQCEDIACRSVAPMQDTPAIRVTYGATVTVEKPYVVHMSANKSEDLSYGNDTHSVFYFENNIPMASYLIAIAVGNL
jgi:leukotriene-A4 hydrolase